MSKMTVIQLLNKIANDGKIPERINFNEYEYRYHDKEHGYCRSSYDCTYICLDSEYYLFDILNDEVEIIEEDKKIEKLELYTFSSDNLEMLIEMLNDLNKEHVNKINEIIDYLEENK